MRYLFPFLCWAIPALGLFISCTKHHAPPIDPSVPAFDKVNGEPTANADAGRGRSESKALVQSPRFPTIYFAYDDAHISEADFNRLSNVIRDAGTKWVCYVDGHTSDEGTDEYNAALGARRASVVGDYIQTFKGITVVETSYGEERPKATRELSRRVEIKCK